MVPGMTQPTNHIHLGSMAAQEARCRQIAAIHALADWYVQHQDEPMPGHIVAVTATYPHQGDQIDQVHEVAEFANRHGVDLIESWTEVKATAELLRQDNMSIRVVRTATVHHGPCGHLVH